MVEGYFNAIEIFYPGDSLRIVARFRLALRVVRQERDGADVAARVAIGPRIDADEREVHRVESRFFLQLTPRGVLYRFADFDKSSWQRQRTLVGWILPPDHQYAPVRIYDNAVGGQGGRWRKRHGQPIYVESSNVKTATSAGVLLYRDRSELEVMLGHPGGPYWRRKDEGSWTVPKGEVQDGEDLFEAALREFGEEIGFHPTGPAIALGSVRQAGGKHVHMWAIREEWEPETLVSNTFSIEWPPRSGRMQDFPEIDRAQWFDLATARSKIQKSQAEFLNRLEALVHSEQIHPTKEASASRTTPEHVRSIKTQR